MAEIAVSAKLAVIEAETAVRADSGTPRVRLMLKSLENAQRRFSETLLNLHRVQTARGYAPGTRSPESPAGQPVALIA